MINEENTKALKNTTSEDANLAIENYAFKKTRYLKYIDTIVTENSCY